MKMKIIISMAAIVLAILLSGASGFAQEKVIIMGYKSEAKMPFIEDDPSNAGAYVDLYTKAAKEIGYTLKIVREPKKRILLAIKNGEIDFWPGADFDQERAEYMYYLDNGFSMTDVLFTAANVPEVKDFKKKFRGTLLVELGSTKAEYASKNIKLQTMSVVNLSNVDKYIKAGRGDAYIDDSPVTDYYLKEKGLKDFSSLGLKAHYKAFGGSRPMYVGFSMKSPLFKGTPNPNYDPKRERTIQNFPVVISRDCPAYQLYLVLQKLKKSGETSNIYNKHFK
jgi:ABC-type amino acid transport substrate-binding protein